MKISFIAFVAYRYFRSRRRSKGVASTILSVLGVAVGVMTLTAVLAVMNGFQLGFIESILQISSYDLQIKAPQAEPYILSGRLLNLPEIEAVVPFTEQQAIIQGVYEAPRGCLIRAVPADVAQRDPGFIQRLLLVDGSFDLERPGTIVLGVELARHLGIAAGDTIGLMSLEGESFNQLEPIYERYLVTGLFKCGYYEFDLGLGFIPLTGGERDLTFGVKIRDRFRDQRIKERIESESQGRITVASWRDFNQAFFRALRMEKMLMMVLIGLIFVVVGFNIYHSLRRTVRERFEEIGVLKALGAGQRSIQYIFVVEGLLIGLLGGLVGMILGLLIAGNINQVFALTENLSNFLVRIAQTLVAPLLQEQWEQVSFFSPTYFYISEVPSRVLLHEAVLIFLFALFSSTLAAHMASRRITEVHPAEVLRYE